MPLKNNKQSLKVILGATSIICRMKYPYSCFFTFLFSRYFDYCLSVCAKVVSVDIAVTGCWDQHFFVIKIFLESLNCFLWAIFNAGESSSRLIESVYVIFECKTLNIVINFLVLWSIYLSSSFANYKNGSEYLTSWTSRVFIPLNKNLLQFEFEKFSSSPDVVFSCFFFNLWLLEGARV